MFSTLSFAAGAQKGLIPLAKTNAAPKESVRWVFCSERPELKRLAERARELGNANYSKILALLAEDPSKSPQRFDIVIKKRLRSGNRGEARWGQVHLNGEWFVNRPGDFDKVFTHEMAHVAQHYRWGRVPSHWVEGLANFTCYKLGFTNDSEVALCSGAYPHYTSGYCCTGAFLLYLESAFGSNVIRLLDKELRHGSYSDTVFIRATGEPLAELWNKFQTTPAYTADARAINALQEKLGFSNGKPPPGFQARLRQLPGSARFEEAAEALMALVKQHQLPGIGEGEHGRLNVSANGLELLKEPSAETYPLSRTVLANKHGNRSTYHYVFVRSSEESTWKLQKAWQTSPDGRRVDLYVGE